MKKFLKFVLLIIVLYFLLLIPIPQSQKEVQMASRNPFIWGQDKLWDQLEVSFKNAKEIPSGALDSIVNKMTIETDSIFNENEDNYMLWSNFNQIKEQIEEILKMDEKAINKIAEEHPWMVDHVSTCKVNMDHVFEFLKNVNKK